MIRALFLTEWRRLRPLAVRAAGLLTLLLALLAYSDEVFVPSAVRWVIAAFACSLTGLLLGLHQLGSWRGSGRGGGRWSFLVHRPLAPPRIFLALAGAAALALAVGIALPLAVAGLLATVGGAGSGAGEVAAAGVAASVEMGAAGTVTGPVTHAAANGAASVAANTAANSAAGADASVGGAWPLLVAPYAWGVAVAFWLVGCLLVLRPWRGVALAVTPLVLVLVPSLAGVWSLLPLALWLGWLASAALRADLATPPRGRAVTAAAVAGALPVLHLLASFALLLAYSLGVAFAERGWRGPAEFAWNDYYPAGTRDHVLYRPAREALLHGLRAAETVGGAGAWEPALDGAEVFELVPQRGSVWPWENAAAASWTGTRLTARLDERGLSLFPGASPGSGPTAGPSSGSSAGAAVGPPAGPTAGPAAGPAGGTSAGSPAEPSSLSPVAGTAVPPAVLPTPGHSVNGAAAFANLDGVAVAAVDDGALVTFVTGRRSERGFAPARQTVWSVGREGAPQLLVDLPLGQGAPAWVRHRGFLLSPLLQTVDDMVRTEWFGVGPGAAGVGEAVAHPPPPPILGGALLVAVATAGVAWWLAGRRGLAVNARRGWVIAALLLGPPLLFAMPLFTSRHPPET